jgi:hypothetical protein
MDKRYGSDPKILTSHADSQSTQRLVLLFTGQIKMNNRNLTEE